MRDKTAILHRMDDWVNAITVKELRQAVQGKFVITVLYLFLVVAVGSIGIAAMTFDQELSRMDSGREAFLFFMAILMGTCLLFIPTYTGTKMANERYGDQTDLLFSTTLKPGAIVRGKFYSGMILCVLIYSVCMPFMTLTYLLRGIDLPSIFFLLLIGLLAVMVAVQVFIFLACLPLSKWFKGLIGLGACGGMFSLVISIMAISNELLRSGIASSMGSWKDFWGPMLTIVFLLFLGLGFLYVLTIAMISPPSANRALPVRIYMTCMWLIGLIICFTWGYYTRFKEVIIIWLVIFAPMFCLAFLAGLSEREELGPRVARTIPRRRVFRIPAFLFYSGAGNGVIWSIVMMVLSLLITALWMSSFYPSPHPGNDVREWLEFFCTFCLYMLGYGFAALMLRRLLFNKWIKPVNTWILAFILMAAGSILPMIFAFLAKIEINHRIGYEWFLANPFGALFYDNMKYSFLNASAIFAAAMFICALPWLIDQVRQFQPLHSSPPSESLPCNQNTETIY